MTNDDSLRQLLSVQPGESEISEAAARARRRALERFDMQRHASPRVLRWPILATVAAVVICGILVLWRVGDLPAPATPLPIAVEGIAEPSVKVILTLADGTRVIWTIDGSFSL